MGIEEEDDLKERFSTVRDVDKLSIKSSSSITSKELIQEIITVRGFSRTVTRYYVTYSNGFRGVGWIIDSDIDNCIICNNEFGLFLRKHHCRSCGNIICHDCSDNFVIIEEMSDLGEQRVCNMCYWGQEVVYATNTRRDEDDDDDSFEEEDFIIASKINATINASVKAYHFVLNKYPDYSGEMILEQGCDWKMITKSVVRDMNIYSDLETVFKVAKNNSENENGITQIKVNGNTNPEKQESDIKTKIKELIQQISIKYFVLVDADGEALSPNLDNARLFWQFVDHYSVIEKTYFIIYFTKASQSILELGKRGKTVASEIQRVSSRDEHH